MLERVGSSTAVAAAIAWLRASTNAASETSGLAQVPLGTSISGATIRRWSRLGTAVSSRAKRAAPRVFAGARGRRLRQLGGDEVEDPQLGQRDVLDDLADRPAVGRRA